MTDPTLIADLVRAGVTDPDLLQRVVDVLYGAPTAPRIKPPVVHYVYGLIDPRSGAPFYIGVTCQPSEREKQHRLDPCGAAFKFIQQLSHTNHRPTMRIIAEYTSRQEALDHEHKLINSTPGLINKDRRKVTLAAVK